MYCIFKLYLLYCAIVYFELWIVFCIVWSIGRILLYKSWFIAV